MGEVIKYPTPGWGVWEYSIHVKEVIPCDARGRMKEPHVLGEHCSCKPYWTDFKTILVHQELPNAR